MTINRLHSRVVIVGAGPAGLRAACELAPHLPGQVLVLEREGQAGGIPRHSQHTGYGIRDLHRLMTGPEYARRLVSAAARAGAAVRTRAAVTGWVDEHTLAFTSPAGLFEVSADAIILATGARERPRTARRIPGDRPAGVLTTGQLQNAVYLQHQSVGRRAVVVGAELVSWSAVLTLRHAGCDTVMLTSEFPRAETYGVAARLGSAALRTPVRTRTRIVRVIGRGRVEGVEVEQLDSGVREVVACDTVVFTGDWIPDHELARSGGIAIDPDTLGPAVDASLRTLRDGVFAAGNLTHPVDTADVAALDGAHVARSVASHLRGERASAATVELHAAAPFRWVAPSILRAGDPAPPRGRLLLWSDEYVALPSVVVRQAGRVLARRRVPWPAAPGRVFRVPWQVTAGVATDDGPVVIGLA